MFVKIKHTIISVLNKAVDSKTNPIEMGCRQNNANMEYETESRIVKGDLLVLMLSVY